jgi:hypothetical protein
MGFIKLLTSESRTFNCEVVITLYGSFTPERMLSTRNKRPVKGLEKNQKKKKKQLAKGVTTFT